MIFITDAHRTLIRHTCTYKNQLKVC